MNTHPELLIIAGPNGAGKSTLAPSLIRDFLNIKEFVNADVIAQGLAAFDVESVAVEAGRIMLTRLRDMASNRKSFAFETTLAARSYATWIEELKKEGYRFHLIFLWLPSSEFATERVAERVTAGGHNIPQETVKRRYTAGLRNFFALYQPLADMWRLYDNSDLYLAQLIASGKGTDVDKIGQATIWKRLVEDYGT